MCATRCGRRRVASSSRCCCSKARASARRKARSRRPVAICGPRKPCSKDAAPRRSGRRCPRSAVGTRRCAILLAEMGRPGATHENDTSMAGDSSRVSDFGADRGKRLGGAPAVGEYTIQPQDVAGPFVPEIPKQFVEMAQLPQLAYHSPRQLIAAKFHMSEGLLAALNPGKNFTEAGTVLSVANVPQGGDDPAVVAQALHEHRGRTGSSAPPEQTAARVVVNKQNRSVQVFSADNRLLAFLPASIGS